MAKKCKSVEGKSYHKNLHQGRDLRAVFADEINVYPLRVDNVVAQNVFVVMENGRMLFEIGQKEEEQGEVKK